jgi:hypothetical protein
LRRGGAILFILLAVLLLAEFSTIPMETTPFRVRPPAADRWLADQPAPFVVAEIPFEAAPREQTAYMLHSMVHWQKTVHGYSGFEPAQHTALYGTMRRLPEASAIEDLKNFGVTYLVVHSDRFAPGRWPVFEERLAAASGLELLFQDDRSRVYRLRR